MFGGGEVEFFGGLLGGGVGVEDLGLAADFEEGVGVELSECGEPCDSDGVLFSCGDVCDMDAEGCGGGVDVEFKVARGGFVFVGEFVFEVKRHAVLPSLDEHGAE